MEDTHYLELLEKIAEVQEEIQDIHPFLSRLFPIAIAEGDQFLIYDVQPHQAVYGFIKTAAAPMPIPTGVRAAFPLDSYDQQMVCVVTPEVFDALSGYVIIFHEFMHCQQGMGCEPDLKQKLGIARKAEEAQDFMWEINHAFPYTNPEFVQLYTAFLAEHNESEIGRIRVQLKALLTEEDYEYMVWQEWKEGFARYIENRIQDRLGLLKNFGGQEAPFSRVAFYAGGAHFIEIVGGREPGLLVDIEGLFGYMIQ